MTGVFFRAWLALIGGFCIVLAGCGRSFSDFTAPYPESDLTVSFEWTTHTRLAPGSDNWATTWASDGNHYTVWGDGGGFDGTNSQGRVSLGVARIGGDLADLKTQNVFGGFEPTREADLEGKSYGLMEMDGRFYMWVSPGSGPDNFKQQALYTSDDLGLSWDPANISFSRSDGLLHPTFCQAGRSHSAAPDEYVYVYVIEIEDDTDLVIQRPGRISLLRVPPESITDRSEYEFLAGIDEAGAPRWSVDLSDREPVFEDVNGVGWNMSAVYHPGLKRFMLLTEHGKSWDSRLGIFSAPNPWGPWQTVYYGVFGEGEVERSAFHYNLPSGWIDEETFVMVFSGVDSNDSWNAVRGRFVESASSP